MVRGSKKTAPMDSGRMHISEIIFSFLHYFLRFCPPTYPTKNHRRRTSPPSRLLRPSSRLLSLRFRVLPALLRSEALSPSPQHFPNQPKAQPCLKQASL